MRAPSEHRLSAEGRGFEPRRRLPAYTLSRRAPSSARASLRRRFYGTHVRGRCYSRLAVTVVAWSAIGLLAATLMGSFYYLGSRIDSLGSRIDGLGGRLDGRIDQLSRRIDSLESRLDARLDALTSRMDTHLEQHAG